MPPDAQQYSPCRSRAAGWLSAARMRQDACDKGLDADEFVEDMKRRGIRVAGIGHRIKSKAGTPPCPCRLLLRTLAVSACRHGRPWL